MATIRLTFDQEAKLRYLASRRGATLADIYREAIDDYLSRQMPQARDLAEASGWDEIAGVDETPHSKEA